MRSETGPRYAVLVVRPELSKEVDAGSERGNRRGYAHARLLPLAYQLIEEIHEKK